MKGRRLLWGSPWKLYGLGALFSYCPGVGSHRLPETDPGFPFEINHGGSIYTMEIGKCYQSGPAPWRAGGSPSASTALPLTQKEMKFIPKRECAWV